MEINDFASKVEKAYKDGKNRPGFNGAVKYMQDVVRKAEIREREAATKKAEMKAKNVKTNKEVRDEEDYTK